MYIIIKNKNRGRELGKTRSEQEENLRKEWGRTINDEQLDKLKFIERKKKEQSGSDQNFVIVNDIDKVK